MNDDVDDKPTIILDFNQIKNDLAKEEQLLADEEVNELLFNDDDVKEELDERVYAFSYKTKFFTSNEDVFKDISNIDNLDELNDKLTNNQINIILFYYNDTPQIINQIVSQIKIKFSDVKTVLIAKNLSAKKAETHSKGKYGANSYLSAPLSKNDLNQALKVIE